MQDKTNINLVASEVAGLWNSYMDETMAVCIWMEQPLQVIEHKELVKV